MGAVTSYARARAESLGMQAKRGIAERADRMVAILLATGVSDWWTCRSSSRSPSGCSPRPSPITVLQRILMVRKQAMAEATPS